MPEYQFIERQGQPFIADVQVQRGSKWHALRDMSPDVQAAAEKWLAERHTGATFERAWSEPVGIKWKPPLTHYRVLVRYFTPGADPDTFQEFMTHGAVEDGDKAVTACSSGLRSWKTQWTRWEWQKAADLAEITCRTCRKRLGLPWLRLPKRGPAAFRRRSGLV
jgi:hypothetical protein